MHLSQLIAWPLYTCISIGLSKDAKAEISSLKFTFTPLPVIFYGSNQTTP